MSEPVAPPTRILVVEDHPDTLRAICGYLEQSGHAVFSATSVAEGLEALPALRCEVLISDIGLPDGTGWNLLERTSHRPPFAIAMSGYGRSEDRTRSAAVGFRHHVTKPADPNELDALLVEAARERGALPNW